MDLTPSLHLNRRGMLLTLEDYHKHRRRKIEPRKERRYKNLANMEIFMIDPEESTAL